MIFPKTRPVSLRDVLFPLRCVHCGGRGLADGLCPTCMRGLRYAPADLPPPDGVDTLFAAWVFDEESPVRSLVHTIKFGNAPFLGERIGRLAGHVVFATPPADRWDAVVPVPLHRVRRTERGYNQSERLAAGLVDVLDIPIETRAIQRIAGGAAQVGRSREERLLAMRGAFRARMSARVSGRRLLLVDDVVTTGATLSAAARALRTAGAKSVDGFVAAVALTSKS